MYTMKVVCGAIDACAAAMARTRAGAATHARTPIVIVTLCHTQLLLPPKPHAVRGYFVESSEGGSAPTHPRVSHRRARSQECGGSATHGTPTGLPSPPTRAGTPWRGTRR